MPEQFEIAYCDACGKRLTPDDFELGDAVRASDGRVFCERCAPKAEAFLAGQGAGAAPARAGGSGGRIPSLAGQRRPSSRRRASSRRMHARRSSSRRSVADEGEGNATRNMFIVAAVLGVIAFVVLALLMREPAPEAAPPSTTQRPAPKPESSPLAKGLVGHWKFDEAGGTTAADASGNGNTGTLTNGPVWAAGKVGGALRFDGADDHVLSTKDIRGLFPNTSVTIAAWIKPTAAGVVITELNQAGINTDWHNSQIEVLRSGEVKVQVWQLESVSLGRVEFGSWHHVVMRYDQAAQRLDGFLDGKEAGADVQGNRSTPENLYYGIGTADSTNLGDGTFFDGIIDDVRVYSRALTAAEIRALAAE